MKYENIYKQKSSHMPTGQEGMNMNESENENMGMDMGNGNPACMAIQQALPQLPEDLKAGAEQALASGQCEQFIQMLKQQAEQGSHNQEMAEGMPMAKFGARFGKPLEEIEYGKKIGKIGLYEIAKAQQGMKKKYPTKEELISKVADYHKEDFQNLLLKKAMSKLKAKDIAPFVSMSESKYLPPKLYYHYLLGAGVDKEEAKIKAGLRTDEGLIDKLSKLFRGNKKEQQTNTYIDPNSLVVPPLKPEEINTVDKIFNTKPETNTYTDPNNTTVPVIGSKEKETITEMVKQNPSFLEEITNIVKEGALKTISEDEQEQYFLKQMAENNEPISIFTDSRGVVHEKAIPDPEFPNRYKRAFVRVEKTDPKTQGYLDWTKTVGINKNTKDDYVIGEISEYAVRLGIEIDEQKLNSLSYEEKLVFLDSLKKQYEEAKKKAEEAKKKAEEDANKNKNVVNPVVPVVKDTTATNKNIVVPIGKDTTAVKKDSIIKK